MKRLSVIFTTMALGLLVGCSSVSSSASAKTREYARNHELVGQASWYGSKFHGKLTASGEKYNMRALTAAHKTLPFGTIVKVTNTETNKSIQVKINDRGPYAKNRVIDLSQRAFEQLGDTSKGLISVRIDIIDDSNTFRYKH
ncbi:rare lipoprotein A precursor [Vibrio ishigakensis]|uniref:Endolytic peptidoglycan transglycosylase RlpA n=1 Tax=Vibrio ishigakensis TaxID=1481914 RepID=A0A0B8QNN9_9VIBR|nr:rare lipoprotein A precursor [Vibrio ishigakensis]